MFSLSLRGFVLALLRLKTVQHRSGYAVLTRRSDEDTRSGAQQLLAAPSKQAAAAKQGKDLFA